MTSTETALRDWRFGSTQAERLVSGILRLENFTNVQPQAPLGGGDDGADILCERGRYRWVCAVYFPPTVRVFRDIKEKFLGDLTGAVSHKRNGFVFITNQRLTRGERSELRAAANSAQNECEVYDVERIRGVLDSPEGYGLRVGYLQIPMNNEEQVAFFAKRENQLSDLVSEQSQQLKAVLNHLTRLRNNQHEVYHSVLQIAKAQKLPMEPFRSFDPLAIGEITASEADQLFSKEITSPMLRLVHRLVCFDIPPRLIGQFRTQPVFLRKAAAMTDTTTPNTPIKTEKLESLAELLQRARLTQPVDNDVDSGEISYEPTINPPDSSEIPQLIETLCARWNADIVAAITPDKKIDAVARFFHGILFVHPFMDGNGRVARAVLMQQCVELFGHVDMSRFDRGAEYYAALQSADHDNFLPLKELIARAVTG